MVEQQQQHCSRAAGAAEQHSHDQKLPSIHLSLDAPQYYCMRRATARKRRFQPFAVTQLVSDVSLFFPEACHLSSLSPILIRLPVQAWPGGLFSSRAQCSGRQMQYTQAER